MYARICTRVYIRASYAPNASNAVGVAAPLGAAVARNYARKRSNAPNAPMPGVQKSELSTLQRVTLGRDSQSAWSLTRRHWQRVVSLDRSIRPTSFFILGGNINIVTLLNAFMETFLARNVHFTFIMFAR